MPRVSVHDMWMIGGCPTCGADPAAECISASGNGTKGFIHMARYDPHSGVTLFSNNRVIPLQRAGPRLDIELPAYPLAARFGWLPADVVNHPPLRERMNGRKFTGKKLRQGKYKGRAQPARPGGWTRGAPLRVEET